MALGSGRGGDLEEGDKTVIRSQLREKGGVTMSGQNKVPAVGVVGEVYKTSAGLELADPYEDDRGWKQETSTTRVRVESHDVGTHLRWQVWVEAK